MSMRRSPARARRVRQTANKNFIGLTEKVFAVIESLSRNHGTCLSADEIAKATALSSLTLDRLLYSIQKLGGIEQVEDGKYRLSKRFYALSDEAVRFQYLPRLAKPVFNQLLARHGESVHISVIKNDLCVVVAAVESLYPLSFSAEVGEWNYLHSTAMGKCILAHASEQLTDSVILHRGLPRLTDSTIVDRDRFLAELDRVRAQGYAVNAGEVLEGAACVAGPIFNNQDTVIASLSISGPSFRILKNLDCISADIKEGAARLSLLLGYQKGNLDELLPST